MKLRGVLLLAGTMIVVAWPWFGCTDIQQITDPQPEFQILNVAYGDPGIDPNPCDDYLPLLDGVGTAQEWSLAEPLFLRMSGANGTGGSEFFLELRALWTEETSGGEDRIYFLVRYADPQLNAEPDQFAYIRPLEEDEFCRNTIEIDGVLYCPSPTPATQGTVFDPVIVSNSSWTRLNKNGKEDQVLIAITEVPGISAESGLIDLNRSLLGVIGPPDVPSTWTAPGGVGDVDVWMWRAGRTNLHPINQFPDWKNSYNDNPNEEPFFEYPFPLYSLFTNNCGFAEDLWIDSDGHLMDDNGPKPFRKNFPNEVYGEGIPNRRAECPKPGRDSDTDLGKLNGGVTKELALWWKAAIPLKIQDTLACTRSTAKPPLWSTSLVPGEYDYIQGWALQIPNVDQGADQSARSVRVKGTQEDKQEKGFGVRSVEFMRDLDTGMSDDLVIDPTADPESDTDPREFRLVIGVFNNSGRIASGSSEVRLRFEAPKRRLVGDINRCG